MFQSLFVAADSMPDPFLWIGAGVLVVAVIGLQFGRDTAIMVGGILATAGAVALGAWLVAAWYAAAPQFVAGLAVGMVGGFLAAAGAVLGWAVLRMAAIRGDDN